jgi:hypothetical protein
MHQQWFRDGLLVRLVARYKGDPLQFVTLPKRTVDSSLARGVVAELRNEGYVEEQIRGVIRLTARGYKEYGSGSCPSSRKIESRAFIF